MTIYLPIDLDLIMPLQYQFDWFYLTMVGIGGISITRLCYVKACKSKRNLNVFKTVLESLRSQRNGFNQCN